MDKGYRGYIFSRAIGGNFVPQRVQNLVIRSYIEKRGKTFLLSATEYSMEDCYMILMGLLKGLGEVSAIVFYSTHMLPDDSALRRSIYDTILNSNTELHFALEELSIESHEDTHLIEDLIMVRNLSLDS